MYCIASVSVLHCMVGYGMVWCGVVWYGMESRTHSMDRYWNSAWIHLNAKIFYWTSVWMNCVPCMLWVMCIACTLLCLSSFGAVMFSILFMFCSAPFCTVWFGAVMLCAFHCSAQVTAGNTLQFPIAVGLSFSVACETHSLSMAI